MLLLILVLILLFGGGGFYGYSRGHYGMRGMSVMSLVLVVVIIWLVMSEVLLLLAIGLAVGIPAAMALGQFVAAQLYGIQPRDPVIAVSTVILLTIVSALAGFIPAHRASRIDPILALRHE